MMNGYSARDIGLHWQIMHAHSYDAYNFLVRDACGRNHCMWKPILQAHLMEVGYTLLLLELNCVPCISTVFETPYFHFILDRNTGPPGLQTFPRLLTVFHSKLSHID